MDRQGGARTVVSRSCETLEGGPHGARRSAGEPVGETRLERRHALLRNVGRGASLAGSIDGQSDRALPVHGEALKATRQAACHPGCAADEADGSDRRERDYEHSNQN